MYYFFTKFFILLPAKIWNDYILMRLILQSIISGANGWKQAKMSRKEKILCMLVHWILLLLIIYILYVLMPSDLNLKILKLIIKSTIFIVLVESLSVSIAFFIFAIIFQKKKVYFKEVAIKNSVKLHKWQLTIGVTIIRSLVLWVTIITLCVMLFLGKIYFSDFF